MILEVFSKLNDSMIPLLHCSCDISPGVLHNDLRFPSQERHGPFNAGLEEGHKNDESWNTSRDVKRGT